MSFRLHLGKLQFCKHLNFCCMDVQLHSAVMQKKYVEKKFLTVKFRILAFFTKTVVLQTFKLLLRRFTTTLYRYSKNMFRKVYNCKISNFVFFTIN